MNVHAPPVDLASIHPLAYVDTGTVIGARTRVWAFANIIRKATVGSDCSVGAHATLDGCQIGDGCTIGDGAFIPPGVHIGNGSFVGPAVKFCNDPWPVNRKDGWFDIDDLTSGRVWVTSTGPQVSIGAGAIILPGVILGQNCMIAAGAVVTRDVPTFSLLHRDGAIEEIDTLRNDPATPYRQRCVYRN